ncbi:hypothetical protein [Dyella sp.]|uniref:hypothetical protein n=1 Tax=Dyella sp. TaxID=1869338 RepID=UPI002D77FCEA|nr:hypothetical protein [Dyella sp.]HET7330015.1 hypothetical protein [Dyella sp.]
MNADKAFFLFVVFIGVDPRRQFVLISLKVQLRYLLSRDEKTGLKEWLDWGVAARAKPSPSRPSP